MRGLKGRETDMSNRKIGLVLSGGGAKGAYEAGVWAGLCELGITGSIDGIIGSSVGALNAVLFDTCDPSTSEQIWMSLKKSDLLFLDKARVLAALTAFNPVFSVLSASFWGIVLSGGFSQKRLEALISDNVDFGRGKRSLYAVCTHATDFSLSEVFCLNDYTPEVRKEIVLASSALPLIYRGVFGANVNGAGYLDGGISDNTPRMKLRAQGWRQTITVWLTNKPDRVERSDDRNIDIVPSGEIGNFLTGTIRVSKKKLRADYELGKQDTLRLKSQLLDMVSEAGE